MSLVFCLGSVKAEEFYFRPSINVMTEYDDNKRLKDERLGGNVDLSAYGVVASANAMLGVRSNRYEIVLNNQVSVRRYESDFDLDSDDFKFDLSSNYMLSARSTVGLNANYTRNTTLSSEFLDDSSGTGLVQDNIERSQWSVSPNWNYSLSERQNIQLSYSHSETMYEESDRGSFVDYDIDFFSISFKQQWTPLLSNNLSFSTMLYDVPERGMETTEFTVNAGADYQIMPTWSASAQVGVRFTNQEQFNRSDDIVGLVFNFGTTKEFESITLNAGIARSTSAQGDGRLQVSNNYSIGYKQDLTERLIFSVQGSINDSSTSGNITNSRDRLSYRVKPSIRWLFDKQTSLSLGYQFRKINRESNDSEATSNAVSLTFNYQWDKFSTQRF